LASATENPFPKCNCLIGMITRVPDLIFFAWSPMPQSEQESLQIVGRAAANAHDDGLLPEPFSGALDWFHGALRSGVGECNPMPDRGRFQASRRFRARHWAQSFWPRFFRYHPRQAGTLCGSRPSSMPCCIWAAQRRSRCRSCRRACARRRHMCGCDCSLQLSVPQARQGMTDSFRLDRSLPPFEK